MTRERTNTLYLVALIAMLGAILRLWGLGTLSLWLDEVFTARVAALAPAGILGVIRADLDTPPLHPFIVHASLALGNSEFVLRLPSAWASIISIPLMYVVARRLLGQRTGLLAAMLMAWSPFAVYYAQEARMYALVLMFALLTLYCLLRAIDHPHPNPLPERERVNGSLLPWIGFILSATIGLYTHFFGFFVLGLAVLYAAMRLAVDWRAGERPSVRRNAGVLVLSLAVIAVLYLPWAPVLLNFLRENYAANPYGQSWRADLRPDTMLNTLAVMMSGYWSHRVVRWTTRALALIGLLFMARRSMPVAALVVLTVALPFGVIGVLNPGHFFTDRYFIFMLPMLLLSMAEALGGLAGVVAAGLQRLAGDRSAALSRALAVAPLLAAFLIIPLLASSGLERYLNEPPKPAWRQVARYIAGTVPPGDLIVVAIFPHWSKDPMQHYLNPGGRRVIYAAEEPRLRDILAGERSRPWWVVYAGSERRVGRLMKAGMNAHFNVVAFDFLAVVRRTDDQGTALDDGHIILRELVPRIVPTYQGEVQRVIKGLTSPEGDMGQPMPSPVPTTVK